MKTRRTLFFSLLVFVLGMSLLMLGNTREANAGALTQAEWESIAGYIDSYIQSQYDITTDLLNNEYGFGQEPAQYKALVDNDNNAGTGAPDGILCGVGDDMANRPVLVDNLIGTKTLIPGTSIRNQWNGTTATGGLHTTNLTALRDKVIAQREAGFCDSGVTDACAISVY